MDTIGPEHLLTIKLWQLNQQPVKLYQYQIISH